MYVNSGCRNAELHVVSFGSTARITLEWTEGNVLCVAPSVPSRDQRLGLPSNELLKKFRGDCENNSWNASSKRRIVVDPSDLLGFGFGQRGRNRSRKEEAERILPALKEYVFKGLRLRQIHKTDSEPQSIEYPLFKELPM